MIAFMIWAFVGILFVVLGFCNFYSKKKTAFGFWANADMFPVNNVKQFNKAIGKLWIVYGIVFVILGLPLLLGGQNNAVILLSILGVMAESITAMIVYTIRIEKKYRKRS